MIVTATISAPDRRYQEKSEITPDLPADPIGEVVVQVLQRAYEDGCDPKTSIVILEFGHE